MTPAEYRAAFERELGLCLDLHVRDSLLEALRLGPGSRAWSDALGIVAVREMARAQMAAPSRQRSEQVRERIDRVVRRGRLVAVLGDIAIVATCAGCLLVAIWCIGLAIWRRL